MKLLFTILVLNTLLFSLDLKKHITILLYHHISETTPKSTSISPYTFQEHLKYLKDNNYTVWDIHKILDYLSNKKDLPQKLVAITFDDAYKSIFTNAYPLLKEYNFPFTIYINSAPINSSSTYLTWEELNLMKKDLASFGSHSHHHNFLIRKDIKNWEDTVFSDLKKSNEIINQKMDIKVTTFAYPFGEYDNELKNIVKDFYSYALGQQSGSIDYDFNKYEIPRFSMTSEYGNIDRFRTILDIKPLKMTLLNIKNKIFKSNELEQLFFQFDIEFKDDFNLNSFNCFDSIGEQLKIKKDFEIQKVTINAPQWEIGRHKINCTVASKTNPKIYYWHSEVFFIKSKNNEWYKP